MTTDQGCHRFVIMFDKVVIKLPNPLYCTKWFVKGLKGNIQEARLSKTGNKNLCPVLFYLPLGLLLVMKKASSLTGRDSGIDLNKFMSEGNITTAENKMESFGWFDGQLVCIDYENQ